MKRPIVMVALIATVLATACKPEPKDVASAEDVYEIPATPVPLSEAELIQRGKYLVTVAGCNDCHSPKIMTEHGPEPDPNRLLSGHNMSEPLPPMEKNAGRNGWVLFNMNLTAFVGPWGVSYAANLTPDDTGIGAWTFENFKTAIQKGKYKGMEGSRDLLPPMPWQMYRNMTEEDLKSVFTYLKSLPKVNNLVPAPKPPSEI
ncbi:MAG: diheme cytochrome c-553 [Marivirga sp.]|nr:diheme cytochrome c-553 [Marivirga sp.]